MRVMMLGLRAAYGAQGGIETHVRDIAAGLAQHYGDSGEIEVVERGRFVPRGRVLPAELKPLRLRQIWCPDSSKLEAIVHTSLATGYAIFRRPDITHYHGIGPSLLAPVAKLFGLRVVVTHHGEDYARDKWGSFAKMTLRVGEWCAARFSDARIVIAPGLDRKLLGKFQKDFHYIPNATPKLLSVGPGSNLLKHALTPQKYLIHIGRIVPEKCQMDILEAFSSIDTDCKLVFVGDSDHDSAYGREFKAKAAKDGRVVLTGSVDRAAVSELLSNAAGFLLPSTHEGLPIALLEAMSLNLPVAISDIPSLKALGLPAECYVSPRDIGAIREGIERMVSATEKPRPDWSHYLESYKIDTVIERTIGVYHQALNGRRARKIRK
ncbi:glycosyltransferase [Rhizobium sp. BE258]|uniref:glycosyltransferase n=1 Tax=Rhizobium sp. BE258 TaxID=2817722 RepID=UPI0028643211|nr:glycosyltransferase [Rhizobium sp. BE258]MDR7145219.1 glycosyltransferase involved in cell wall biosynthesis [Rhizobium sp. BE258]